MEAARRVTNREALEERFGSWPSFHDAEVLRVRLDSGQHGDDRASVELDVHVFEMTSEVGADDFYILRLHSLVRLRFDGALDIELEDFGPQNVLDGLVLEWLEGDADDAARLSVELPSNAGLSGALRCEEAAVVSVEPFEPGPYSIGGSHGPYPRLAVEAPSEEEPSAVLYANEEGLREVIGVLKSSLELGHAISLRTVPGADERSVGWLLLREAEGQLEVSLRDRELRVLGTAESLGALADHLESFLKHNDLDDPDAHTHVDHDWSPPLNWLGEATLPLAIAGWPQPETAM